MVTQQTVQKDGIWLHLCHKPHFAKQYSVVAVGAGMKVEIHTDRDNIQATAKRAFEIVGGSPDVDFTETDLSKGALEALLESSEQARHGKFASSGDVREEFLQESSPEDKNAENDGGGA